MTLTATRVGDTVTFKATADDNPTDATAAMELINFEATAGADGMTSGMDEVDLPGQTKHIYLMSDIEAPSTGSFANNKPEGLTLPDPVQPQTQSIVMASMRIGFTPPPRPVSRPRTGLSLSLTLTTRVQSSI